MKQPHRQAHFRIWLALAILLALGFGAGLVIKQPVPVEIAPLDGGGRQ